MLGTSGMITSPRYILLLLVLLPMAYAGAKTTCALNADEGAVAQILGLGEQVEIDESHVPIPPGFDEVVFKVADGRAQFIYHLALDDRGNGSGLRSDTLDSLPSLHTIMFTSDVPPMQDWKVFGVNRSCSLGDVDVKFLGMREMDGEVLRTITVLLSFEGGESVLLFGNSFDDYLEAFRRLNHVQTE